MDIYLMELAIIVILQTVLSVKLIVNIKYIFYHIKNNKFLNDFLGNL